MFISLADFAALCVMVFVGGALPIAAWYAGFVPLGSANRKQ
jgi:hypothetical protein